MYVKRNYGFWMTLFWSKWPLIWGGLYAAVLTAVFYFAKLDLSLPWQPLSVIGIAVAFYLGFKNNSSYDRTWEARKIWGGIVNNSRTFGAAVVSFIQGDDAAAIKRELIYRHIAWLTALRYQLRLSREWEHTEERIREIVPTVCETYYNLLDKEIVPFISEAEFQLYTSKTNMATQIMARQAQRLQELHDLRYFDNFRHVEFHRLVATFYDDQGKSERI